MTEYINPQWRLPNIKEGNNQGYSMVSTDASRRIEVSGLANDLSITDQITISGWMKPSTGQSNKYAFGMIGSNGNNGIDFGFHGSTCGSYANFSSSSYAYTNAVFSYADGYWHHFVVSYNGSKHKIYIDGVFKAENSRTGNLVLGGDFYMFNTGVSNGHGATGELTDVCVFDNALSDGGVSVGSTATGQIADLYAITNPMALASPPQAYYPLGNSAHMGSNYLTPNSAITGGYAISSTNSKSRFFTKITPAGKSNITFSTWYRAAGSSSNRQIFYSGSYGTYYLKTNGAGGLWHGVMVASGSTGSQAYATFNFDYDDGNWHHYIFNFDGSHFKTYIDGVLIKKNAKTGVLSSWGSTIAVLGSNHNTNSNASATGDYSNFVAYDSTLTDGGVAEGDVAGGEIAELYNGGSPILSFDDFPQKSNIETWFKLDQTEIYSGSTWRLNDASSAYSSSLNFNGSSNVIDAGTGLTITRDLTLSGWVKFTSTNSGGSTVICKHINAYAQPYYTYRLYIDSNKAAFRIGITTYTIITGGTDINDGNWHHILGTYDGSNINLYVDGVSDATAVAVSGDLNTAVKKTTIGAVISGNTGSITSNTVFNGELSNTQVFNTALPETGSNSIEALYNNGKPLADMSSFSSLVSWWKLNNTTTGIEDSKGSNDGTNNGATKIIGSVSTKNATTSLITSSNLINQTGLLIFKSYSPYALTFDGNGYIDCGSVGNFTSSFTASCWINNWPSSGQEGVLGNTNGQSRGWLLLAPHATNSNAFKVYIDTTNGWHTAENSNGFSDNTKWVNLVVVYDSINNTLMLYSNTVEGVTATQPTGTLTTGADPLRIGSEAGYNNFNGNISNAAIWNTALSASEVREIYNEGRPSNLHNFSGTAPVAWWQLGSNSSYTSPSWTVLDEIGSNNGTSTNMLENAIVDGVGTSGNGVSTNMGSANNISGSSPNGDSNCLSVNMGINSRSSDYNN